MSRPLQPLIPHYPLPPRPRLLAKCQPSSSTSSPPECSEPHRALVSVVWHRAKHNEGRETVEMGLQAKLNGSIAIPLMFVCISIVSLYNLTIQLLILSLIYICKGKRVKITGDLVNYILPCNLLDSHCINYNHIRSYRTPLDPLEYVIKPGKQSSEIKVDLKTLMISAV